MRKSRKAALIAGAIVVLGLGGAGIAHSQTATPKPTAKPKVTASPKPTPKPTAKPKTTVKAASAAKPVVTTPHHTG